jgi:hypothetical protein
MDPSTGSENADQASNFQPGEDSLGDGSGSDETYGIEEIVPDDTGVNGVQSDDNIKDDNVESEGEKQPVERKQLLRSRPAMKVAVGVSEGESEYVPTGQEVFLEIVKTAGLPADQTTFLIGKIPAGFAKLS